MEISKLVQKGYEEAYKAREKAYAPYSRFLVGACFYVDKGQFFYSGFNIENASYPASLCAERMALCHMFSCQKRAVSPTFGVVVTDTQYALGPCGQCLQVMTEFCPPQMKIYLANLQGIQRQVSLGELIRFDAAKLKKTLRG